ncbi:hypothetical protein BC829DRAFT_397006 [Chytridium lagenaria]|nr:hypothetical protein BC829DRAFT_397006 [Chytridium lagenaria]
MNWTGGERSLAKKKGHSTHIMGGTANIKDIRDTLKVREWQALQEASTLGSMAGNGVSLDVAKLLFHIHRLKALDISRRNAQKAHEEYSDEEHDYEEEEEIDKEPGLIIYEKEAAPVSTERQSFRRSSAPPSLAVPAPIYISRTCTSPTHSVERSYWNNTGGQSPASNRNTLSTLHPPTITTGSHSGSHSAEGLSDSIGTASTAEANELKADTLDPRDASILRLLTSFKNDAQDQEWRKLFEGC